MQLGFTRFIKLLLQNLFIQTSWSFTTLQGMGFLTNLLSGASEDKKDLILNNHKGFFNTHPYMSAYIVGAVTRLYDEGKKSPDEIKHFIAIAQTSLASSGDLLFWETIRPSLLIIAVILSLKFGLWGIFTFIIPYNILHFYHRITGILDGYRLGPDVIYLLNSARFKKVQQAFEIIGTIAAGLLILLVQGDNNSLILIPLIPLFISMSIYRLPATFYTVSIILIVIIFALL